MNYHEKKVIHLEGAPERTPCDAPQRHRWKGWMRKAVLNGLWIARACGEKQQFALPGWGDSSFDTPYIHN